MKPLFVIFLLFFVSSAAVPMYVFAQDNVPVLDEWYSIKSPEIGYASYLRNFIIPSGENSITIKFHSKEKPVTWFNRFPFDTVNQFYWPNEAGGCVYQGDFNGDGVTDYVDCGGRIYKGIENGMPPDTHAVAQYWFTSSNFPRTVIDDFNGDGYDDWIKPNEGIDQNYLLFLLFGGKDLTKLQSYTIQTDTNRKREKIIGFYKTGKEISEVRAVSLKTLLFDSPDYRSSIAYYCLYKINIYRDMDSIKANLVLLDSTNPMIYPRPQENRLYGYYPDLSRIYKSKNSTKAFLIVDSIINWEQNKNLWVIWEILNDKFVFKSNKRDDFITPTILINQSIDGDEFEDYFSWATEGNKLAVYLIFTGNDINLNPKAKFYPSFFPEQIFGIGDINKDGINDFALNSWRQSKGFAIYLGKKLNSGIQEVFSNDFKIKQNEPNPVGSDLLTFLPVEIAYPDNYSLKLYSLDGQEIGELFNKYLTEGSQKILLNLSSYKLTSGFYVLRLSNSRTTKERGILITK